MGRHQIRTTCRRLHPGDTLGLRHVWALLVVCVCLKPVCIHTFVHIGAHVASLLCRMMAQLWSCFPITKLNVRALRLSQMILNAVHSLYERVRVSFFLLQVFGILCIFLDHVSAYDCLLLRVLHVNFFTSSIKHAEALCSPVVTTFLRRRHQCSFLQSLCSLDIIPS